MPPVSDGLRKATSTQPGLPVWITHMWQRLHHHRRLGLILGAGVCIDAGCPPWSELVNRLTDELNASQVSMAAHREFGLQEAYLAEILFRKHSDNEGERHRRLKSHFRKYQIASTWMEIIHGCLYKNISAKTFDEIEASHTYLKDLGELAHHASFTVNFNFDDLVDEATFRYAGVSKKPNSEIILYPKLETRREAPVVYHINGFIPREKIRRRSEQVILTEDAFAEVLSSPNSIDAEFVTGRFATTTFLILGSSLSDNSLKNILRAGAKRNPANHHYIVYWEDPTNLRTLEQRKEIFDVNLNVYNLISIFLLTEEISCLIRMLNKLKSEEGDFRSEVTNLSTEKISRKYYLVGPIAAGKSSTLDLLRCFSTHEEWLGRPPAVMYQDDKTLTPAEQKEVDDFLFPQLMEKNKRMLEAESGLHVMDRGYLDLFAFSKDATENLRKANELQTRVMGPGDAFQDGQIVFLTADQGALEERLARRGKRKGRLGRISYSAKKLMAQGKTLEKIYGPAANSIFNTSRESVGQTAQKIARMIILEKYIPFNFSKRVDEIISNGGVP
jgi:hypothetical protein